LEEYFESSYYHAILEEGYGKFEKGLIKRYDLSPYKWALIVSIIINKYFF